MKNPRKPKLPYPVQPAQYRRTTLEIRRLLQEQLAALGQVPGETGQAAQEMLHWMAHNQDTLHALHEAHAVPDVASFAHLALAMWQVQRQELLGSVVALAHTQVALTSGAHQPSIFGLDLQDEADPHCLYAPLESATPTWH